MLLSWPGTRWRRCAERLGARTSDGGRRRIGGSLRFLVEGQWRSRWPGYSSGSTSAQPAAVFKVARPRQRKHLPWSHRGWGEQASKDGGWTASGWPSLLLLDHTNLHQMSCCDRVGSTESTRGPTTQPRKRGGRGRGDGFVGRRPRSRARKGWVGGRRRGSHSLSWRWSSSAGYQIYI